jgi:hypothetical protein
VRLKFIRVEECSQGDSCLGEYRCTSVKKLHITIKNQDFGPCLNWPGFNRIEKMYYRCLYQVFTGYRLVIAALKHINKTPIWLRKKKRLGRYRLMVFKGLIMKIHRFQFEVMLLMLAVLDCWAAFENNRELVRKLIRRESLQNKPPSPNQIRPPPLLI